MTSKTVLYLSYDGLTDALGRSQILPYLIGLEALGHRFLVVSAEKTHAMASQSKAVADLVHSRRISWFPLVYHKWPPVLSTLYDLYSMYRTAARLIRKEGVTLLHCRSYTGALLGLWLSRRYGVPFLFDMRGFWPDERVEGGIWSLKNPVYRIIYRYFKRMERILLTQADAIVTLTHSAAEQISDWNIPIRRPPMVIPCCVDTQAFPVVSRRSSISGSYLVYLGSLGTWYLLAEMMAFFKVYAAFVPGSKFLVLTRESPTLVIQEARRQGIAATSVEVRSATREEMPGLLSGVALSVFFVKPGFSKKGSSATKLGELLSSGIPVVSNHGIGDQDKFFEQHSIGALVQDFSEASYKAAITKILNTEYSQEALRQVAVELFDLEKGVVKYHTVYQAV